MMIKNPTLTKTILLFFLPYLAIASPPPSPVQCTTNNTYNCNVTNAYGLFSDRSTCHAQSVMYPSSEQELLNLVARAVASKTKMKVATRFSHSMPKLACPGGSNGLIISTLNLSRVVNIDINTMKITVESGITLKALIEAAAKANLALPYTPYWFGLTIGGLLSTGAHGSSLRNKGGAVHEYVTEIRLVTPAPANQRYAMIRVIKDSDPDLDAAKVSLGVLGVLSQVTLQLQPMFKRSITFVTRSDEDLAEQAVKFGHQHEFADLTWYPSKRKVVYRKDDRVTVNALGNGVYDGDFCQSIPPTAIQEYRSAEDALEAAKSAKGKCADTLNNNGHLFRNNTIIGYQYKMQGCGGCAFGSEDGLRTACSWDPRIINGNIFYQTTISVALDKAKEFILDVNKLRDLKPSALCGLDLHGGIVIRFIKASSAYFGKQSDSVQFDFTYYRAREPMTPRLDEDFFEEIEQMALFKYNGLPHWGKNRIVAFAEVMKKYNNSKAFLKVKDRYDPDGLFSSEWSDQILGLHGSVIVKKAGCALEGLCICSDDEHCAPDKGYYCRAGKVYKNARVCTAV